MHKHRHFSLIASLAKWLLTLAALYYVLSGIDVGSFKAMLQNQRVDFVVLAFGCILVQAFISALRWQLIIRYLQPDEQKHSGLYHVCRLNFISMFFNSCLPGTIGGDVIRALLIKTETFPMSLAAYSVVLDRLMALLGVFIMVLVAMPSLSEVMGFFYGRGLAAAGFFTSIAMIGFILADHILLRLERFKIARWGAGLLAHIRFIANQRLHFILLLFLALCAHATACMMAYFLGRSLGLEISVADCFLVIPAVMLVTTLPISIGGWGVREASMVGLFALLGVEKSGALLISIQMGLLAMLASLPGALFWLKHKGRGR